MKSFLTLLTLAVSSSVTAHADDSAANCLRIEDSLPSSAYENETIEAYMANCFCPSLNDNCVYTVRNPGVQRAGVWVGDDIWTQWQNFRDTQWLQQMAVVQRQVFESARAQCGANGGEVRTRPDDRQQFQCHITANSRITGWNWNFGANISF